MSAVMKQWSDDISGATDEASQRALLGRIGVWRATKLSDMVAQRQAAGAMARLHQLLGDNPSAEREARSLISLCQTHPPAPKEHLQQAQALLRDLGGAKAIVGPRPSRDDRNDRNDRRERGRKGTDKPTRGDTDARRDANPRGDKSPRGSRIGAAMELARTGRWEEANQALSGGRGAQSQLARTWIRLAWALSAPDDSARVAGTREVASWLEEHLEHKAGTSSDRSTGPERKAASTSGATAQSKPATPAPTHALDTLLGTTAPKRWRDRLQLLEDAVLAYPDRVDRIAALALDHHVAISGERSAAPWLANLTSTALAAGGTETRAAIDDLSARGVFAVSLYEEPVFSELVDLRRAAEAAGWTVTSLRRGVLSRGEPADRRVWTFRAEKDDTEVLYARAPESSEAWEKDLGTRIARRLPELCPRVAVYAPGAGNASLVTAAEAVGVAVVSDPTAASVLSQLSELNEAKAPPTPKDALTELLSEGVPDDAALDEAVATFSRAYQAFRVARIVLDERSDAQAPAARTAFLRAIDRGVPEHVRVPEGTSWAVRLAATGHDTGLLSDDSRFGGPGIGALVAVATGLAETGFTVDRVQIGASKRERREDPVLEPLDAPFGGLWRMKVGDVEVAVLTDLTPEGRVAATRLLTDESPRVVVVPLDGDLLSWWRSTGGADPIGWTGSEGRDVTQAVRELTPGVAVTPAVAAE